MRPRATSIRTCWAWGLGTKCGSTQATVTTTPPPQGVLLPPTPTPARPPVGTATTAPVLTAQGAAILGVIDAFSKTLDQLVPTFNVPAVGTGNNSTEHPA